MSTILEAQQKQKSLQSDDFFRQPETDKGLLKWRVALFSALLVIITFLSILLYAQFTDQADVRHTYLSREPNKAPDVINRVQSAGNEIVMETTEEESKSVKKVTFDTQPLPEYQQQEKKISTAAEPGIEKSRHNSAAEAENGTGNTNANTEGELDSVVVSDDLRQRFELAILEEGAEKELYPTETSSDSSSSSESSEKSNSSDIYEMTADFQKKVPKLRYDAHMYSSIARDRWIKINGENLKEGQFDGQGQIQLLEIQPNRSVFRFGRQSFSLESLTDWKGY